MKNMKINALDTRINFASIIPNGKKITNGNDDQTDIVIASSVNNFVPNNNAKNRTNNAIISINKMLNTVKKSKSNSGCQTYLNNISRTSLNGNNTVIR